MKRLYLSTLLLALGPYSGWAALPTTPVPLGPAPGLTRQLPLNTDKLPKKLPAEGATSELLQAVPAPLRAGLQDPLAKLPAQLPILNRAGTTAFVEAEVEHGWRAVEREWLLLLSAAELKQLQQVPLELLETTHFDELGLSLVRFRVPAELDSWPALKQRLPEALLSRLDRNHIYDAQAGAKAEPASAPAPSGRAPGTGPICPEPVRIGMIDSAVKTEHPAFTHLANAPGGKIIERNFLAADVRAADAHGTAVAGLLLGRGPALEPLLPRAVLHAASVFYARGDYGQGATMMDLVRALNWLMSVKVSVINMSLAGPDNQILAAAIAKAVGRGLAIVVAVGNEGPAAPPLYPAAYPGVIAVTAVDREHQIYRWANRGPQVAFAALGVSVLTARSAGDFGRESGTSMATPVVAAFAACELVRSKGNLATAMNILQAQALDLGPSGRDDIFGHGLLQALGPVRTSDGQTLP